MWLLYQALESFEDSHHTFNTYYKQLKWSFMALWLGEEPIIDWDGNPIPGAVPGVKLMGGKYMSVWALICDLEHAYKAYNLPNPTSSCPCGLCPANSAKLKWWDFRPNAPWTFEIFTKEVWLALNINTSIIFQIVGVSILSFTQTGCIAKVWVSINR